MVVNIANIAATVGGVAALIFLIWLALRGTPERHAEVDAREFFDEHGYWPDEAAPDAAPAPAPMPVRRPVPAQTVVPEGRVGASDSSYGG